MQQRLDLCGGNATMEMNAGGETGLMHKLLASGAIGALANQIGFNLAGGLASEDQRLHNSLDALLALHHAAAVHHAKRMIRKAGLGCLQRDAVGDHSRVGGGQALAQLLGQELGNAYAAAAVGFRGEGFGDAPVTGTGGMYGEYSGVMLILVGKRVEDPRIFMLSKYELILGILDYAYW